MKPQAITQKLTSVGVFAITFIPSLSLAASNGGCTGSDASSTSVNSLPSAAGCAKPNGAPDQLFGPGGIMTTILNTIIFLVGAVAVVMLIIGGFRYVISGGSKDQVSEAKNTIMYALIGIVIAVISFAIVNFVTGALGNSGSSS
jgi:hypothetical protein